jgi:ferredoxin-NADP reductase/Na+-translocating ferredoxin:NAD+ oxidoreductase RnfD subunit
MNPIDAFLNKITMYRLVLYYLTALVSIAVIAAALGILHYSPVAIIFSTVVIIAVSWVANEVFAHLFKAHPNVESVYITALILALIMSPVLPTDVSGLIVLVAASIIAMGSKYIFAIRKTHIFNPAAIAVVITGLLMGGYASWWVGNLTLLPLVAVGGLLIVRKVQRFDLVLSFAAVSLVMTTLIVHESSIWLPAWQLLVHSAFFFFAFVMLTEPATMPATRVKRIAYGAAVGLLYAPGIHLAAAYSSPEIALTIGNLGAYLMDPKVRRILTLLRIEDTSTSTKEFVFSADKPLRFKPGQYVEWTLPHARSDSRGNRRYFTIASAPTDTEIRLGVKFYEPSSSFKRALAALRAGDKISVANVNGDFVLPEDATRKVVLIAGGIGITPFASMIRSMLATHDSRSAILLYSSRSPEDISYRALFEQARAELGIKTIYAVNQGAADEHGMRVGVIDMSLIKSEIPDYAERTFYLSGPRSMVVAFKRQLAALGIHRRQIKTDFFPGLV